MSSIPRFLHRIIDDAAIFPPGNSPLPDAVEAHQAHLRAAHADLVGPFVVSDVRLPDLLEVLREREPDGPLGIALVVTGGAGALEPAVRWADRAGEVTLLALETALREEDDPAHNARRLTTMAEGLRRGGELGEDVPLYVEMPRAPLGPGPGWLAAADELAMAGTRLKFRTGGADPSAFPAPAELAGWIFAALDRETPFKCTAGLHRAVRHRDQETGAVHHGFLNVLLATRASLDGATTDEVAEVLSDDDPDSVVRRERLAGTDELASARRWFTSVGSCSVQEPLDSLLALGLLPALSQDRP